MWLYAFVHLYMMVFGFVAGSIAWAHAASYGNADQWWIGGGIGFVAGWIIAHLIIEQARNTVKASSRSRAVWRPPASQSARDAILKPANSKVDNPGSEKTRGGTRRTSGGR